MHFNERPPELAQIHLTVALNRAAVRVMRRLIHLDLKEVRISLIWLPELLKCMACELALTFFWLHLKSSGSTTVAQKYKLLAFCSQSYLNIKKCAKLAKMEATDKHLDNVNRSQHLL